MYCDSPIMVVRLSNNFHILYFSINENAVQSTAFFKKGDDVTVGSIDARVRLSFLSFIYFLMLNSKIQSSFHGINCRKKCLFRQFHEMTCVFVYSFVS